MTDLNLRARREELGLTLKEVANQVGVSEATVSRWESGDIENMKRSRIALLANVLQISPLDILGIEHDAEQTEGDRMIFQVLKGATEDEKIMAARLIEAMRK